MKNVDEFLDEVKAISGSDYKTSKMIGTTNQLIGNWRGRVSMPSNKHVIAMCNIAEIDLGDAIRAIEYSRENERPLKEAGFIDIQSAIGLGAVSLTAMTYPLESAILLGASVAIVRGIYIMRS